MTAIETVSRGDHVTPVDGDVALFIVTRLLPVFTSKTAVSATVVIAAVNTPSLSFSMFIGVFLSLFLPLCIFPFSHLSLSCRSPLCLYPTICTCSLPGLQCSGVESNSSYRYTVRWSIRLRAPQVHKPCGRTTVQAAGNNEKYLAAQYLPRTHIINARVV